MLETCSAQDMETALRVLVGRWKLVILFHLFGGKVLRFSDFRARNSNITQKMLGQQLLFPVSARFVSDNTRGRDRRD